MQKQKRPLQTDLPIWMASIKKGDRYQPPFTKYNTIIKLTEP